jgi:XRE family transcriptional regulator, stress-response regulator
VVSEEATDTPQPEPRGRATDETGGTVLRFPSNRPRESAPVEATAPRLGDVLGEVLREERNRQQRTLADVAEAASVSLPYLSEVERGRKQVSSDVLHAIGDALDLPLVTILERSVERLRTGVTMSILSGEFRMQRGAGLQLAA